MNHSLALVCHDADLHDESLFSLMRSLEKRAELYKPLHHLKKLVQTRLDEIEGLAKESRAI